MKEITMVEIRECYQCNLRACQNLIVVLWSLMGT